METPQTIAPREWETSHIESHKLINIALLSFTKEINNLIKSIKDIESKELWKYLSENLDAFSKDLKNLELKVEYKIDSVLEKITTPIAKEIITKEYSGIAETTSENILSLERIEFKNQWAYKVDIVIMQADQNINTLEIRLPEDDIIYWSYAPTIGIRSKNDQKAILEYKFKVLFHEI